MSTSARAVQSGFTLIEALAAVVVLSIGFFVFLGAMADSTRALSKAHHSTQLALLATSIMESQAQSHVQAGRKEGDVDGVHWQLTSSLAAQNQTIELFRLELVLEQADRKEYFSTLRIQGQSAGLIK